MFRVGPKMYACKKKLYKGVRSSGEIFFNVVYESKMLEMKRGEREHKCSL